MHFLQIANSDKPVVLYSLDMVISVGYRVSSKQATLFRRRETSILVQFSVLKIIAITKQTPHWA